ncbi:hypothetical protein M378DRAFT_11242 [Amanita muscaria Koide BX008]|uniref:Uncharacterized protein n=1 Tax=Amanita muscaria (strain Koide BX008) TaxID=946122 RepID=A0A0C2TDM2_AMAMK|nr:hypothetical protein M378DRAFT_377509 [Amanita muscaria Koide BX008]KIL64924.1 hypothetical protein M378DRAFT_11242 [Amanita muscaria Koide BX008]
MADAVLLQAELVVDQLVVEEVMAEALEAVFHGIPEGLKWGSRHTHSRGIEEAEVLGKHNAYSTFSLSSSSSAYPGFLYLLFQLSFIFLRLLNNLLFQSSVSQLPSCFFRFEQPSSSRWLLDSVLDTTMVRMLPPKSWR